MQSFVMGLVFGLLFFTAFPVFADEDRIEFHVKDGTDGNDWNTAEDPVLIKNGQRLIIFNDDTRTHQLHTFGRPCAHGGPIEPGKSSDYCLIYADSALGAYTLYDHRTLARFYVTVIQ